MWRDREEGKEEEEDEGDRWRAVMMEKEGRR